MVSSTETENSICCQRSPRETKEFDSRSRDAYSILIAGENGRAQHD